MSDTSAKSVLSVAMDQKVGAGASVALTSAGMTELWGYVTSFAGGLCIITGAIIGILTVFKYFKECRNLDLTYKINKEQYDDNHGRRKDLRDSGPDK